MFSLTLNVIACLCPDLLSDIQSTEISAGGYTGDTGRLTDGHRSVGFQLLACLNAEASYIFVINVFRKLFLLQFLKLLYLLHLAADVTVIFDVDLYLLTYIFRVPVFLYQ